MAFLLGIDIGTSGTKALVCDLSGKVLATATAEHDIASPQPGWSEQDPQWWWEASVAATRKAVRQAKVKAGECKAIGLSGQMHGFTGGGNACLPPPLRVLLGPARLG